MPSKEVLTFWLGMGAPIWLLSRVIVRLSRSGSHGPSSAADRTSVQRFARMRVFDPILGFTVAGSGGFTMWLGRRRGLRRPLWAIVLACMLVPAIATDALAGSWTSTTALSASGGASAYPGALAASSSTVAHATYEQLILGNWVVNYRRTTDSGGTWSPPVVLSRPGVDEAGAPVVAADGQDVDAAWIEGDDIIGGTDSTLTYRHSTDAGVTWEPAVQLSPLFESAGFPRIARQGSRVAVVWTNELNGRMYTRLSTNGGASFSPRVSLATTTNKPFGGSIYEAFPAVAFGRGALVVGYYSSKNKLKIRRSTNGGATWKAAQSIATNARSSWAPAIAANGSTVLVGYAVETRTSVHSVIRRSTNKGGSFGKVVSLSPASAEPSFLPVITYRGGFRAVFERCTKNSCKSSAVYYRSSSNGKHWSSATKASAVKRKWGSPAGVDVAGRILVLYTDSSKSAADVYIRRGK